MDADPGLAARRGTGHVPGAGCQVRRSWLLAAAAVTSPAVGRAGSAARCGAVRADAEHIGLQVAHELLQQPRAHVAHHAPGRHGAIRSTSVSTCQACSTGTGTENSWTSSMDPT